MIYAIEYMRPDGWWEAGRGWDDKDQANADAANQLPDNVTWRIVEVNEDDEPGKAKLDREST